MSYTSIADAAEDPRLLRRVAACAAEQGLPQPYQWAVDHAFAVASAPTSPKIGDVYGDDPAVITDGMILAAVQAVRGTGA